MSDTFREVFYIAEVGEVTPVYQLRLIRSHFVMSTDISLPAILLKLEGIIKRYKTMKVLNKRLKGMEGCKEVVSTKVHELRVKEYKVFSGVYKEVIEGVIDKASKEIKVFSPAITMKRMSTKVINNLNFAEEISPIEVTNNLIAVKKRPLMRVIKILSI